MEEIKNVILYTIDCPKCIVLEKKLNAKGVLFEKRYDTDEMKSLGIEMCPVLSVNGGLMNFKEAIAWVEDGVK